MHDPIGTVSKENGKVIRRLYKELGKDNFLYSNQVEQLVACNMLINFQIETNKIIVSNEIPFVTYPYEWCDAQLYDSAVLTLDISQSISKFGYELKDASAWNVIFEYCKPVFCDHLSFQKIETQNWWAFGQFIRHFILPLVLSKYKNLKSHFAFVLSIDGIQPDFARELLGLKRYLSPFWVLFLSPRNNKLNPVTYKNNQKPHHHSLYAILRFLLGFLKLNKSNKNKWIGYKENRDHYASKDLDVKHIVIEKWIKSIKPSWVIDLGCNTGEYTMIAASLGAVVVAVDQDHDSIQELYLNSKQ